MMKFRENEDAVSPVIGVILMVAITVILAAVIAAFVFGMTDNIAPSKDVYVTTTQGVDDTGAAILTVTIQGGKDVSALRAIQWSGGTVVDFETAPWVTDFETPIEVGDSGTFELAGTGHYIVRGVFADNTVKILAEKDYVGPATP